ncbi:MAG: GNAT family N-acetyltransferase [Anaerolineae bacterium]|jgi:ribosomal protein S18 acetylase RimI-like enzyme|nr:GNAT family N-acetyltransferase [Anaerolineae bacterium]
MSLELKTFRDEEDFFRIRNFLRNVFLTEDRLERSWSVPRFDYWRWHLVENCGFVASYENSIRLWENPEGRIAAVLHPVAGSEMRLHVHPDFRTPALLDSMLICGEETLAAVENENEYVYLPVDEDDGILQSVLEQRGYVKRSGISHKWHRDLVQEIPEQLPAAGYSIRSMGTRDEHPARSWASWRAFHGDEPDSHYDGDWSWYENIQRSPLYRRDLDIVAEAPEGGIASFCTILYDDYTRSAVCVLVGTAVDHQRRGLGKAVITEGLRRAQNLGCTRVFATAYDPPANALYGSVMEKNMVAVTWMKQWKMKES